MIKIELLSQAVREFADYIGLEKCLYTDPSGSSIIVEHGAERSVRFSLDFYLSVRDFSNTLEARQQLSNFVEAVEKSNLTFRFRSQIEKLEKEVEILKAEKDHLEKYRDFFELQKELRGTKK